MAILYHTKPPIRLQVALLITVFAGCMIPSTTASDQPQSYGENTQINLTQEINCIAINDKLNKIYAALKDSIAVVDGATKQVVTTIKIPDIPTHSSEGVNWIFVDSTNNKIWFSSPSNEVWIIDGQTNQLTDTQLAGRFNTEFAINPQTNSVYIPQATWMMGEYDTVDVYSGTNFKQTGSMGIPGSDQPIYVSKIFDVAVDPETNRVYAKWNMSLCVFDGATKELIKNQPTGDFFLVA